MIITREDQYLIGTLDNCNEMVVQSLTHMKLISIYENRIEDQYLMGILESILLKW